MLNLLSEGRLCQQMIGRNEGRESHKPTNLQTSPKVISRAACLPGNDNNLCTIRYF